MTPNSDSLIRIQDAKRPISKKQVQSFLGLTGLYQVHELLVHCCTIGRSNYPTNSEGGYGINIQVENMTIVKFMECDLNQLF